MRHEDIRNRVLIIKPYDTAPQNAPPPQPALQHARSSDWTSPEHDQRTAGEPFRADQTSDPALTARGKATGPVPSGEEVPGEARKGEVGERTVEDERRLEAARGLLSMFAGMTVDEREKMEERRRSSQR